MRFAEQFQDNAIPEWKQCYLNYQLLKILIKIIEAITINIKECEEMLGPSTSRWSIQSGATIGLDMTESDIQVVVEVQRSLDVQLRKINQLFYLHFALEMQIFELFYLMKTIQIEKRESIIQQLSFEISETNKARLYLFYLQYSYIEISYLQDMREDNQEAQRKILKKHHKYAQNIVPTPKHYTDKIDRIEHIQRKYIEKVQNIYIKQYEEDQQKEAKEYLRQVASKMEATGIEYFSFGLWVGTSLVVLATLIFIIVYQDLSVENDSVFARDFPVWRGSAIFILYIWVLGFNVYCYETYKISHRLIFKYNDHLYSSHRYLFRLAGFFTTVFLVMFLFYLMIQASLFKSIFPLHYFPLIPYAFLAAYFFVPLPIFNYRGRLYTLKLIMKCFLGVFKGVEFPMIFMTDQWISMITPFRDLSYTFCYITQIDFSNLEINPCKISSTFQVAFIVIVITYSCRLLLTLRLGYDEGAFCSQHLFSCIRVLLIVLSSVLAYLYNKYPTLLVPWIVVSSISTAYAYIFDLKVDWDLLQHDSEHCLLRKYLTFSPKRNYYIIILINLILRLSWVLTLSPSIATLFGNAALVTLLTGSAQIIRRGIWNLLRVEREHLSNCNEFRAVPDLREIEDQLKEEQQENIFTNLNIRNKQHNANSEVVNKEFVDLLKEKINERELQEQEIGESFQEGQFEQISAAEQKIREMKKKYKKKK